MSQPIKKDCVVRCQIRQTQIHLECIEPDAQNTLDAAEMDGSDSAMDSSLSSHASSEFGDEVRTEEPNLSEDVEEPADTPSAPPAKKQRLGQYAYRASTVTTNDYDPGEISSDTSGSIPSSPWASGATPEDDVHEQVTVCKWLGCEAGDLGNMDILVQHIHDDHIGVRQKKYACEWEGCSRLGMNHASGYALRAHMRSHTREKPFFCALPGKRLYDSLIWSFANQLQNATNPLHDPMPWRNTCAQYTKRRHSDLPTPSRATTLQQARSRSD